MAAIKALLRLFSLLFHALLALFLIAISGLALASGARPLRMGMLPWTGSTLLFVVFFGALFGLATVILAIAGKLRLLFLVWSLAVAVLLPKGYIFSGYHFSPGEISRALYLIAASWVAVAGAWFQLRRTVERKPRY